MKGQETSTPRIIWDIGTAYDFFASNTVLNDPETFGLRASWAAGVRSRLPQAERKFLEDTHEFAHVSQVWTYNLPAPKDASTALWALRQIPAKDRLMEISFHHHMCGDMNSVLQEVAARGSYTKKDVEALRTEIRKCEKTVKIKELTTMLDWWMRAEEFGELFLQAMQSFYQNFFAEEEKRIAPILKQSVERGQELAAKMPVLKLVETLSQGIHLQETLEYPELVLAPSFWMTPFIIWNAVPDERMVILYGGRPEDMSLIPGEDVPDTTMRVLKALADPTRLKIMRYLAHDKLTPAQLAKRLRLRAPTVIHHLNTLRMAGLVSIILDKGCKCYSAREEAIGATFSNLGTYLEQDQTD